METIRPPRQANDQTTHLHAHRTWIAALLLIGFAVVARLIYLVWFCPYQLIGDESYYWEQARHLDLCYNEKGPALAWMIYACCKMFGDHEWVVRLPMLISFALAAWGVGKLAMSVTRGNQRVALLSVLIFCLVPAFEANAQICTQDGPLIALWVALTAVGLSLLRKWHRNENTWPQWMLLWFVLGVAFIFKQSILVFLPGLALYWLANFRQLKLGAVWFAQQFAGVILFTLIISPMIVWNYQHGWPMLAHTLGHLGAGGDQAGRINAGNPATWFFTLLGGVLGAIGPAAVVLMIAAGIWARRQRSQNLPRWNDRFWLMCAAWPSILFFVLLSLTKPVIASWPLPSFVPLVILMAEMIDEKIPRKQLFKIPRSTTSASWVFFVWYGVIASIIIAFPTLIGVLPGIGPKFNKTVAVRFTGFRQQAAELQNILPTLKTFDGQPPVIVTRHYMQAGQLSFYLPGHPVIHTAGKDLGKRSTTFDQWTDTRMDNPRLYGRTLLLIGDGDVPWEKGLIFDSRVPVDGGKYFLAANYQGVRPDHPTAPAAGDD